MQVRNEVSRDVDRWIEDPTMWITDDMRELAIKLLKTYARQMEDRITWYGGVPSTTKLVTMPGLQKTTHNVLVQSGVRTIGELMQTDRSVLLRCRCGLRAVHELETMLDKLGIDPGRWL